MEITINNKQIKINFSFRADIIYENITGKSFEGKNETEWITYFFANILCKVNDFDFDKFLDWLDDNPAELSKFISAYIERQKQINLTIGKKEGEEESSDTF